MRDRPIIFSAPMIRALLDGRKTMTRRALKPQPIRPMFTDGYWWDAKASVSRLDDGEKAITRFAPGDRLWVRENWQYAPQRYCTCPQGSEPAPCDDWSEGTGCKSNRDGVVYAADGGKAPRWRPSIHMPRWASRITLIVEAVKVERLQDISEDDAEREGCHYINDGPGAGFWIVEGAAMEVCSDGVTKCFERLWESINGHGSWDANPWVCAISFRCIAANIDSIEANP